MKKFRLAVIAVCISMLLSLFGCGKLKPFILDGPDMERTLWSEFTISQTSDVYEENFSYTVKYDKISGEAYFYTEVPHETKGYPIEKSIQLKSKDLQALININIMSFANVQAVESDDELILDGTFLKFWVTDSNGEKFNKSVPYEDEKEILKIIKPYADKLKNE